MSGTVRFYCTGFGSFQGVEVNPTQKLILDLCSVVTEHQSFCFPVSARAVDEHLPELLSWTKLASADDVSVILSFGVASGNRTCDLEKEAVNEAKFRVPDETGFQPQSVDIICGSERSFSSSLPTALLAKMLWQRGHGVVRQSSDAGRFLCNFLYYRALHLERMSTSCGIRTSPSGWPRTMSLFVHVPNHDVLGPDAMKRFAVDLMSCIREVVCTRTYSDAHAESAAFEESTPCVWTERGTTAAKSADFTSAVTPAPPVAAIAALPGPAGVGGFDTGVPLNAPSVELHAVLLALGFKSEMVDAAVHLCGLPASALNPEQLAASVEKSVAWIIAEQEKAQCEGNASEGKASSGLATIASHFRSGLFSFSRFKLAIVVRSDLGMTPGKISAQACHAALKAVQGASGQRGRSIAAWRAQGEPIVVLKCDDLAALEGLQSIAAARGVHCVHIRDAGRTQVAPSTVTVIAVGPEEEETVNTVTGALKLL